MNALSFRLLRLIADGEFHSGAALARELGVSRGTIWNAVRAIEAADLGVYKVPGRGYKLAETVSLLDPARIAAAAGNASARLNVEVLDVVDSTNTLLMGRAQHGAPSGAVLAAEWQHGGRGRMGRAWQSGVGRALTFSLLWRFAQGAGALAGLSLAAGVGVIRALHAAGLAEVQLKWPNDILWRGCKLGGLLIEMHGDALGPSAVVIGIGMNVRLSDAMRSRIDQPAADLESALNRALDRSDVLGKTLAALVGVLDDFAARGFPPLREEWERHHAYQDARISVKLPGGTTEEGVARGVGEDGALLFQCGKAVRRLHSGEVSVRSAERAAAPAVRNRTRSGA
jgi:BirA family biotin operon repressor/biotin-[acetyl-CoA-carboxylase] ligase